MPPAIVKGNIPKGCAQNVIVTTVLLPVAMAMFGIAQALVSSIESGTPMRVVVLDGTGKLFGRLRGYLQADPEPRNQDDGNPTAQETNPDRRRRGGWRVLYWSKRRRVEVRQPRSKPIWNVVWGRRRIDAYSDLCRPAFFNPDERSFRRNTSDPDFNAAGR
mgnify:CR=1 FL=1